MMITPEFIKQSLAAGKICGISGVILKDHKVFITVEINKEDDTDSIKRSICDVLAQHIDKANIQLIFTNKDIAGTGKKKLFINGVKNLIFVASGKGGVGKSTIAVALARQYYATGKKVGLIDADIYGPSIPTMFNIYDKPEILNEKFIPIEAEGIKLMSVGFLVDFDTAIAWRGPMASKILYQMLSTTDWGELDYLIVDMPPGTGDVHLSLLENYKIDGAVIVTTPQVISMIDVDRAMKLYRKFNIPILGIIENMYDLFPGDAGRILAEKYNVQKIQRIAFDKKITEEGIASSNLLL